ncbi:MAG TPA: site-2 protease family protein [Chloroflexota bacterium]
MTIFGPIDLTRAFEMIIILLIAIDVHELAHAIVADRLGDSTPRRMGELSPNPFVHMDQVGILLLVLSSLGTFAFTYGRTHVTPTNLKWGPQRGNAIVAAVGPLSNLALAAIIGVVLSAYAAGNLNLSDSTVNFLFLAIQINILLFAFNLLPLPPLDGFTVLGGFLSARQMYSLAPLQQWGPLIILVLIIADPQIGVISAIMNPVREHVLQVLCSRCV